MVVTSKYHNISKQKWTVRIIGIHEVDNLSSKLDIHFVWMWWCHNSPKPCAPLLSIWYHLKGLDEMMCILSFCNFWSNGTKVIKLNFILREIENYTKFNNLTRFYKNSKIKLTSTKTILKWMTLQEVQYTWASGKRIH
jgi:hypothetical protein